ncbi:MAG TPA: RHS repeat-associated core domain-containing protein, partial [Promineifilum sp.]|nr:RHS repeat-associated core domain-containing protein [Promineifilum sp.]
YTFDVENQPASVRTGNQTMSFAYDADGQRVLTTRHDGAKVYTPFPDYEETVPASGGATKRVTFSLAGQLIAVRVITDTTNNYYYAYADHLGNISAWTNASGALVSGSLARYEPFGGYRTKPASTVNPDISDRGFTGHRMNNSGSYDLGLIYMNARYYMPEIGRFISADTIVPDPGNPQSYNRYSYSYNNPVNYTDSSGHCIDGITTWACVAVALKVVDYGWTAWDTYQSGRILANLNSTSENRFFAALNVSLAIGFEMLEPDDFLPVGLPADDIGRRALLSSAKRAYTEGGTEAVEAIVRDQLGDNADAVLNNLWDALCCSGQKHHVLSNKIMDELGRHRTLRGVFQRDDVVVQALDNTSHRGYQTWHRAYDDQVVDWLIEHETATSDEFLAFLTNLYSSSEMQRRFPQAVEILQGLAQ